MNKQHAKTSNRRIIIVIPLTLLLSLVYGILVMQYQIFPFTHLHALLQHHTPQPSHAAPSHQPPTPSYADFYNHKQSFFQQHGGQYHDVVFIGDSITDAADWQDLFPSLSIANRGINRDRTDGILKRMPSIYATGASKAFIMIGINDFSAGVHGHTIFTHYKHIVRKLLNHHMDVYIQSTILSGKHRQHLNRDILILNKRLQLFAQQTRCVTYIELNTHLTQNNTLQEAYSLDGTHLNGEGYAIWKKTIEPYLK